MPPQKNAGNKKCKKESGTASKNKRFVQDFLDDLRKEGDVEDVYVARVLKKLGNGRMEIYFIASDGKPATKQALLRGSFRGKGKHSVWVDAGSIVVVADSHIPGSAEYEIMAVLNPDQVRDVRKELNIDPRVLAIDNTDTSLLMKDAPQVEDAFVFEEEEKPEEEEELDVDAI